MNVLNKILEQVENRVNALEIELEDIQNALAIDKENVETVKKLLQVKGVFLKRNGFFLNVETGLLGSPIDATCFANNTDAELFLGTSIAGVGFMKFDSPKLLELEIVCIDNSQDCLPIGQI